MPDDLGAAVELCVHPSNDVRRRDRSPAVCGKRSVREWIVLGIPEQPGDFWVSRLENFQRALDGRLGRIWCRLDEDRLQSCEHGRRVLRLFGKPRSRSHPRQRRVLKLCRSLIAHGLRGVRLDAHDGLSDTSRRPTRADAQKQHPGGLSPRGPPLTASHPHANAGGVDERGVRDTGKKSNEETGGAVVGGVERQCRKPAEHESHSSAALDGKRRHGAVPVFDQA